MMQPERKNLKFKLSCIGTVYLLPGFSKRPRVLKD